MRSVRIPFAALAVVALVAVVATAGAFASGDQGRHMSDGDSHHAAMGEMFERIGVTADQRRQLEDAHRRNGEATGRIQAVMDEAHERLAKAMHSDVFDETAIRSAAADYGAAQADLFVAKAQMRQEARRILTPDQFQQMHAARGRAHGAMQGHGGGHGMHGHGMQGHECGGDCAGHGGGHGMQGHECAGDCAGHDKGN